MIICMIILTSFNVLAPVQVNFNVIISHVTINFVIIIIKLVLIIIINLVIIIINLVIMMMTMFTSHNALTQSGCCPTTPGSQQSHREGAGPGPG